MTGDDQVIDPSSWKPTSKAVAKMQAANRILANGAGYESWLQTTTLTESKIVKTADRFKDRWIREAADVEHKHGPVGETDQQGKSAFTTWLDPDLAIQQARVICDTLVELAPDKKPGFETRFGELEQQLRDLRKQLLEQGPNLSEKHVVSSQPVFQYLARALNLSISNVNFHPTGSPSEQQWKEFDALLAERPAALMIWNDEPTKETRAELAKREISVVVFDPLNRKPTDGDFLSGMQKNIDRLKVAIEKQ